ncbi:glycosyltransferase family 2 protein [Candidatus Parcubacteria bacterium]|nr:glycosyltransferase family 2 protein [Candidatus Parcubacteria bacterium]
MKKTAVIIVNYKNYAEKFLRECRDSLRAQNYPKELYQIYIIDNASSEKSRNYLKKNYPEAIIIPREDGNYSAANNAGIKKALEGGCEYFVIANMDAKFDKNWLVELVKAVRSDEKIGIAQSKILLYPKTEEEWKKPKINSLGNIIHFLGFGFTKGYNESDYEIKGLPEIKGYASGCSFIVKKEVIDKINGYNEEYYMYHDDMEISWKAKLAGYRIVLAPKSIMRHKYDFARSISMLYYMERNRYIAIFTFYSLPNLLLIFPAAVFMDFGILLYSIANGWFLTKLKVYGYFLKPNSWLKIFKQRQKIKSFREIKDSDIARNFLGEVLFQEIENPVLKYIANPIFNFYWNIVKKIL